MDTQNVSQKIQGPRLIGVGDLFASSWSFFKEHIKKLALIALLMLTPSILTQLLDFIFVSDESKGIFAIIIILTVLSVTFSIIGAAAMIAYINKADKSEDLSTLMRYGVRKFWGYLLVAVLGGLATVVGLVLLIIPGIAVMIYISMAVYAYLIEEEKGMAALRRSYHLIKSHWWATFGRLILLWLISIAISLILGFFTFAGDFILFIVINIFYIFLTAYSTVYLYTLFMSLKELKDTQPVDESNKGREINPNKLEDVQKVIQNSPNSPNV